jgi:TonB family protein
MRFATARLLLLSLLVACCAAGPILAQEEPLTAGSDGVPVPKKTKHVQPVYPAEALSQGIRGIVILDIVIDTSGKVASTSVLRSVPGLDEAAIAAARQWEYEPTKVKDTPVSVRVTVPITFALALPRITRQTGIPELRQGVSPSFPQAGGGAGTASVEVTLEPDGRIGDARLVSGEAPWSDALMAALKTWRFAAPPDDAVLSFRVEAEFARASGSNPNALLLRATGLQRSELIADASGRPEPQAPAAPAAPAPAAPAARAPQEPAPGVPQQAQPADPTPQGAPAAPTPQQPTPQPTPTPVPAGPVPQTPAPQAPTPAPVPAEPAPGTPPPGAPTPRSPAPVGSTPAPEPAAPTGQPPAAGAAPPAADAPPPIEVLTAPPPAPPMESGISAIRDVTLEPGVPELARGRRPVAPPIARLNGARGTVEVSFSVGSGGQTALQTAAGPEILRYAAEQTVTSWVFRRTRADRAYLVAVFDYDGDKASAVVRPQAATASAPEARPATPVAAPAQPAPQEPLAPEPPAQQAPRTQAPPEQPPVTKPPTGEPPTTQPPPPGQPPSPQPPPH